MKEIDKSKSYCLIRFIVSIMISGHFAIDYLLATVDLFLLSLCMTIILFEITKCLEENNEAKHVYAQS